MARLQGRDEYQQQGSGAYLAQGGEAERQSQLRGFCQKGNEERAFR